VFIEKDQNIEKAEHFEHNIFLKDNKPRFKKKYPFPDTYRPSVETQIQEWLKMGIIQPSQSSYNVYGTKKGWLTKGSSRLQKSQSRNHGT
jgi:hypothetical protein